MKLFDIANSLNNASFNAQYLSEVELEAIKQAMNIVETLQQTIARGNTESSVVIDYLNQVGKM